MNCQACTSYNKHRSRCTRHSTTTKPDWWCVDFEEKPEAPTYPPPAGLVRCTDCRHTPGRGMLCHTGHRHAGATPRKCQHFEQFTSDRPLSMSDIYRTGKPR